MKYMEPDRASWRPAARRSVLDLAAAQMASVRFGRELRMGMCMHARTSGEEKGMSTKAKTN